MSRHHRIPQCVGGRNTFWNTSILCNAEHALWHSIYGARCAAYTISAEHMIQKQLGLKERVGLVDIATNQLVYIPTLEVSLSRNCLHNYITFRDGLSQDEYYQIVNQRYNDPWYRWQNLSREPNEILLAA